MRGTSCSSCWIKCHINKFSVILKFSFHSCVCEVKQDNVPPVLVLDSHPQTTGFGRGEGHFYCVINKQHSKTVNMLLIMTRDKLILRLLIKTNKEPIEKNIYARKAGNSVYSCSVRMSKHQIRFETCDIGYKRAHQPDYFIYHSCKHLIRIHQSYWFHSDCVHVNVATDSLSLLDSSAGTELYLWCGELR